MFAFSALLYDESRVRGGKHRDTCRPTACFEVSAPGAGKCRESSADDKYTAFRFSEMVCKDDKEIGQANEGGQTDTGTGDNICGGRTKNGACKKIVAHEERSIGCDICQRRFHVEYRDQCGRPISYG